MNNLLPKVTFFLPVYNEEKRIERCIESILKQDYPKEKIEILLIDGGSEDRTKEIASSFECVKIFDNPKRLADFGIKICMRYATGDLFVIFAADNELVSSDWLRIISSLFINDTDISAVWCKMISSSDDAPINKYYELIQNDPLSFFINKNLQYYLRDAQIEYINEKRVYIFNVFPEMPLIWGANGLVYRTNIVKEIILQDGFLADNDVFQITIESGFNRVAYIPELQVYHHHVKRIKDWVKKWSRNYTVHFLTKRKERNLRWAFDKNFSIKLLAWIIYSGFPIFSLLHSIYLAFKDKTRYWLYHPLISFIQMLTYSVLTISTKEGRRFIKEELLK